jgi:N-acetyl-anhydromuramyl-L-alanine amidase AmpD
LQVIAKTYDWAHPLVHRNGSPPHIVWHHAAAKVASPDDIHRIHLNNGWSGIGYHFYVRKDGRIYRGRPVWAMGAHARGFNDSLGVCAEGAYHVERTMPAKQLRALQELHDYLKRQYPKATDRKHSDVNATACPGSFYPYKKVRAGVPDPVIVKPPKPEVIEVPVPVVKPPWWRKMRTWLRLYKKRRA